MFSASHIFVKAIAIYMLYGCYMLCAEPICMNWYM